MRESNENEVVLLWSLLCSVLQSSFDSACTGSFMNDVTILDRL